MTTNLDIIKKAMKKIHVLPRGTEPTSAEASDGMDALQSLIVELIGQGSLGRLYDVLATSAYTVFEQDRVRADPGVTVTIPDTITNERPTDYPGGDGYDYGFGGLSVPARAPRDRAVVVVFDGDTDTVVYHVYSAYKGEWVVINGLTQQDDFPFADYLEDGFAALLAERIVDDFDGAEVGKETKRQANGCRMMLSTKPDSQSLPADVCMF
jgi:hypothetical protein